MPTAVENRTQRINARVRATDKALIEEAANLEGLSVSNFMVRTAKLWAQEVLRRHQQVKLTPEASLALHHLLFDQTDEPPAALREALALHDQLVEMKDL